MKKLITLFCMLTLFYGFSQNAPINFETAGNGTDWTWTVFENNTNPALVIIANPDPSEPNSSATVAQFTALQSGQPWAGCESAQGSDLGEFVLDETNNIISIMVWKPVISDVGIKLVSSTFWSQGEIKVPNTLVNQWERLTFDFSSFINPPAGNGVLNQIVIFPDFDARTQDNIIFFDNIVFSDGTLSTEDNISSNNFVVFPNPATVSWHIHANSLMETVSIFNILGEQVIELNPNSNTTVINNTQLASGLYFATIKTENGYGVEKLLKK